jgi:hypothetical protein
VKPIPSTYRFLLLSDFNIRPSNFPPTPPLPINPKSRGINPESRALKPNQEVLKKIPFLINPSNLVLPGFPSNRSGRLKYWILEFLWSLEVGIWSLIPPSPHVARSIHQHRSTSVNIGAHRLTSEPSIAFVNPAPQTPHVSPVCQKPGESL